MDEKMEWVNEHFFLCDGWYTHRTFQKLQLNPLFVEDCILERLKQMIDKTLNRIARR